MRRKKWVVASGDRELASVAAAELNIDPLAALIASSRGFDNIDEINDFFDEYAPLTIDPMIIKDMDKAAERINRAIDEFEMICVYGDYDADGVTSTALLYSFLESRGANVIRYIPDRISEGYGLNIPAIDKLASRGVRLIVTVDNGATAIDEIAHAYEIGLEVVVTDHHKVGEALPVCEAVVDPQRPDCTCPYKEMSGVGVAFKLACAIDDDDPDEILREYGELVAMGTIGDVVSLIGENRVMVRRGISYMNSHPGVGVAALIKASGVRGRELTSMSVAYTLCPRINAAGRMGSADKALELLLCDDPDEAAYLADEINNMNARRQATENEIFGKALEQIQENPAIANDRIIVVVGEEWHQGVVGIVAAKLTEHFGRPSVVISRSGDEATGSCRSIPGFSIYDAIKASSEYLTHYGGHTLAAGLGLKSADIERFRRKINDYAADKKMPFAEQRIDLKIQLSGINLPVLSSIAALEPFGASNPQPLFGLFGVTVEEINNISDGKHTRLIVSKNDVRIGTVYFGMPERRFPYEKGDKVDLAVNLEKNVYNNETRVSVVVRGIRPSDTDEDKVLEALSIYDNFSRGEKPESGEVSALLPDRETEVEVFRSIQSKPLKDGNCEELCVRLGDDGTNLARYMITVDVMTEMGILSADAHNRVFVPHDTHKVNLEDSQIMKKLRNIQE
ncbi:MAG: single-stranded-DNA-specific exonuclease RecJ [Clostridia bacterium]|nr:single-stranded-DNA-specific exonuclease RecJ [Clostridia bacterium]